MARLGSDIPATEVRFFPSEHICAQLEEIE